jgi:hypothetical protein
MQTTLRLLESDSPDLWGVLMGYPSGYQQQIACSGACSGSLVEVGKEVAARALADLLAKDRGLDASLTNWASVAAGCAELFRVWKSRQGV